MMIDTGNLEQIIGLIVALIAAIIAYLERQKKEEVIAAYTPGTPESGTPSIIAKLPERSWKMSEATRHFITMDANEENRVKILAQVDKAEEQQLTHYRIDFNGGYYLIEYGLQYGGAGTPSGK